MKKVQYIAVEQTKKVDLEYYKVSCQLELLEPVEGERDVAFVVPYNLN